jgi:acetyl-CoA acetyltransferase
MAKQLTQLRPVYVVGIGLHRYQPLSETSYVELGVTAIRQALADGKLPWEAVESSYVATALLGAASGRPMLRHLGALGRPLVHVGNASASGSAAFRLACIEVASGISDVALATGVDKPTAGRVASRTGIGSLTGDAVVPFTHFALLTNEYSQAHGLKPEDVALVALKNHRNGALNPYAQRQKVRTLDEILEGKKVSGSLTALQCTPVGEGAAAVVVASEEGIRRWGLDSSRAIRVAASAANSEPAGAADHRDEIITTAAIGAALAEARMTPKDLDVIEVHDAFTIEELLYAESTGVCPPGQFIPLLKEGAFDIGGQVAISPSGGLLAMGHPIGPTGVGQVAEVTRQLRGEAGPRQHKGAKVGLAHMVGIGAVCYVHILSRP